VVFGVVAAGLVLRFVSDSALWLDEALTVNIAGEPIGDIGERLRHDGHPPLYYWLLHLWMVLFGDGDVAVRALSGVFAVAALPFAWIHGRRLGGAPGAVGALFILAASPFAIRYATEARQYSLVTLLALVGWLLLERARQRPTLGRLLALAASSGILLLTHYWAAFLLGAVGLLLVVHAWRLSGARGAEARSAVALAAGGLLFLPWLPSMLHQLENTGTPWASAARPTAALAAAIGTFGSGAPEGFLLSIVVSTLVVLAVTAVPSNGELVLSGPRGNPTAAPALVLALGIALAAVASYLGDSAFEGRYFAVFLPIALVLAGVALGRIPVRTRVALMAIVGLLMVAAVVDDLRRDRTQAGQVVATVLDRAGPDDVLVVCPDQLGPAHERLLGGRLEIVAYPELDRDVRFIEWVDYLDRFATTDPEAVAAELLEGRQPGSTVWLAWESAYRVVGDDCARFADALGRRTQSGEVLFTGDPSRFFETASLHAYRVPG
jgi:mannosyltransferase